MLPSYKYTIREYDSWIKDKSIVNVYPDSTGQMRKCLRLLLQPARREIKPILIPSFQCHILQAATSFNRLFFWYYQSGMGKSMVRRNHAVIWSYFG